jgi:ABC-type lipoprotein release transport system permease subunit
LAHRALGVPEEALRPGSTIGFEGESFEVAGVFAAPGTVLESEIWFARGDLMALTQRETLSCVVLRMEDRDGLAAADLFAKQRFDLELSALRESDYYAGLSRFYAPIRTMAWITALLVGAGAVFGGLNMLYAAFASRLREMATLQAMGFRRPALFLSILQESLLATLLGTLLAGWIALLLLDGRAVNFSLGTFRLEISGTVALAGLGAGLALGVIGTIPPALRCLRTPLPAALRG